MRSYLLTLLEKYQPFAAGILLHPHPGKVSARLFALQAPTPESRKPRSTRTVTQVGQRRKSAPIIFDRADFLQWPATGLQKDGEPLGFARSFRRLAAPPCGCVTLPIGKLCMRFIRLKPMTVPCNPAAKDDSAKIPPNPPQASSRKPSKSRRLASPILQKCIGLGTDHHPRSLTPFARRPIIVPETPQVRLIPSEINFPLETDSHSFV